MPYRRTEQVEARLASNHVRILRAARQLVAEGGFREAQVAAVATVAGVATGTVYRYFPSKADLCAEIVSSTSQREVDIVAKIAKSGGPATQRLADALRAFASRALRGRRLAYALVAEPVDPEVESARLKYRRMLGKVLQSIVREGIVAGDFPAQPTEASAACLVGALLEGLIGPLAPTSSEDEEEGKRLIEAMVTFCLRAVSGKEHSAGKEYSDGHPPRQPVVGHASGHRLPPTTGKRQRVRK
jgi:AcrR family transcriptional regulator